MDWQEGLSPAARERLARVGGLSDAEKAAAADAAGLDETLRLFFRDDITGEELLARLKDYETARKWELLKSARDRLQSSFKASDLRIRFTELADGTISVVPGEPEPSEPKPTAAGTVIELTDTTFDAAVRDHPLLVVDCWAVWCGPCRMVAPVIEELARDYAGRVTFGKLDVDKNRATATRFAIQSIPTMLIFKNGHLVDQKLGAMPKAMLEPAIKKHLDGGTA
ncbi:MAG: thioredoxin [Dehalococcoidia bacterium]|nr:thioredoxin [Dehalococcoidia bacterium]